MTADSDEAPRLLAVDCGLRTGIALFSPNGRLLSYRSQNLGNRQRLKRAASGLLRSHPGLTDLVIEGGGDLATIWMKAAERANLRARVVPAEAWRTALMIPRDQRDGATAKARASTLARRAIAWSEAPAPTSLRHDAAEAILVGLWAAIELGMASDPPSLR